MAVLSLPSELLFEISESPLLDITDVKNLRFVHPVFRDHAARRLFSYLRVKFIRPRRVPKRSLEEDPNIPNSSLTTSQMLRNLIRSSQFLTSSLQSLNILVEGRKGDGFATFLKSTASKFFENFTRIENMTLDFSKAFEIQSNDSSDLKAILALIQKHRSRGLLQIVKLKVVINWKWLKEAETELQAVDITSLKVLTHNISHRLGITNNSEEKGRIERLLEEAREAISKGINGLHALNRLDLSSTDPMISLENVLSKTLVSEEANGLQLKGLTLRYSQLPKTNIDLSQLKGLECFTIVEGSPSRGDSFEDPKIPDFLIWPMFKRSGVQLKRLSVPILSSALLKYLGSTNGGLLEDLTLQDTVILNERERSVAYAWQTQCMLFSPIFVTPFVDICSSFREHVIPTLSTTIKRFSINMQFDWKRYAYLSEDNRKFRLIDMRSYIFNSKSHNAFNILKDRNKNDGTHFPGLTNLLKLLHEFDNLHLLEIEATGDTVVSMQDIKKAEVSICRLWRYVQPKREKKLWAEGMVVSIKWHGKVGYIGNTRRPIPVMKQYRSEFALILRRQNDRDVWKLVKVGTDLARHYS